MGEGSFHKSKDKGELAHLLENGWDTPVGVLVEYAAETEMSTRFWSEYVKELEALSKSGG